MELFKEVITQYYDIREKGDPSCSLEFLPYSFTTDSREIIWSSMEEEFTRTLINAFNDFSDKLYKLYILDKIIREYSVEEQDRLRFEFTAILLSYCLSQPNEWRNKVIYFSTHLCHQANLLNMVKDGYKDNLPEERSINFNVLKKVSKHWLSADELNKALDSIGNRSEDFKTATSDYRDRNQHRLPPSLEMGLTNIVKRVKKTSDSISELTREFPAISKTSEEQSEIIVAYEFGFEKPLKSQDMFPVLAQQSERMKTVFYQYWNLVKEQDIAILARIAD